MNKEQWINKIIESTGGMHRAAPADGLYEKINLKISKPSHTAYTITFPVKRWAAAAILLLTINIGSCIYALEQDRTKANTNSSITLADEMQSSSTYNY